MTAIAHLETVPIASASAPTVALKRRTIDTVLIQHVYVIGLETTQRSMHDFADVFRPAVDANVGSARVEPEAELRSDDQLVTRPIELPQRACKQLLIPVWTVRLGSVEKGASKIDGAMNGRD